MRSVVLAVGSILLALACVDRPPYASAFDAPRSDGGAPVDGGPIVVGRDGGTQLDSAVQRADGGAARPDAFSDAGDSLDAGGRFTDVGGSFPDAGSSFDDASGR